MARKPRGTKTTRPNATAKVPTPITDGGPVQRAATPEEQAQIQAQAQRARAEVAILKQRFAETDVAKVIAEAERDQLIQQQQILQQRIKTLKEEIVALKNPKDKAENEDAAPESEEN